MKASLHPTPEQLLQFAHGNLQAREFEEVERHIADCDSCCDWIAQQPDHTLVELAREVATLNVQTDGAVRDGAVIEQLRDHPRYRIVKQIGSGGMGKIYQAEHRLMQRMVALKVVHPKLVANSQAVERFQREVRCAARLSHPNIVASYDADHVGDFHFLVMEHVDGESLTERITRTGPAEIPEAVEWIRQAATGLQHAHEQGMAHRDIKPQNLMLTRDGQLKILDFGLTRFVSEQAAPANVFAENSSEGAATQAGTVLGTPDYIAPEQVADSRSADIRSDIYSLGCTLYYLLTGQPPFPTGKTLDKLHAHTSQPFPPANVLRPDLPEPLLHVLAKMTAKNPGDRYATPGEVAAALSRWSISEGSTVIAPDLQTGDGSLANRHRARQPARQRWSASLPWMGVACLALLGGWLAATYTSWDNGTGGHGALAASDRPAAKFLVMLPSDGLWFPDYKELVAASKDLNTELTFASTAERPSNVVHTSEPGVAVPDLKIGPSLVAKDYQGIIFIGYQTNEFSPQGIAGADTARLLNEFQLQKKVVASLCAGQRVLAEHGALRGKQVTACESVRPDDIFWAGGKQVTEPIKADGLVVTAARADFARPFLETMLKLVSPEK